MNKQAYVTSIELENQALDAFCASPPFETINPTNMKPHSVKDEVMERRSKDLGAALKQAQKVSSQAIAAIVGGAIILGITIFSVIDSAYHHVVSWLFG